MRVQSGFVVSSNPINFIRFSMDAGQIDAGTFRLYGVL
jgi:hypothetical protein